MVNWISRRIAIVVLSAFAAVTIVFWLNVLVPGDAATAALSQSIASDEVLKQRQAELGLDRSPIEQYWNYTGSLLRLDFGRSWATGQSVTELLWTQAGPTASLALTSILLATIMGLVAGLLSFSHTWIKYILDSMSALSLSIPLIFSGALVIWVFAIRLDWLPATGQGRGAQLVLPTLILGYNGAGSIYRVVQESVSESLSTQWVVAARARGISRLRIWARHIVRPSLLPILNLIGLQFGYLLGGVAVVETLFARSGLGRVLVAGVLNKDLPVILAVVLVSALGYGLINLLVDGLYLGLDPRLRSSVNA